MSASERSSEWRPGQEHEPAVWTPVDIPIDETVHQQIALDCPPGYPRPGDLIEDVIAGTGLELRDTVVKFMGCWVWRYDDVSPEEWSRVRVVTKERIAALYAKGLIRYGSW